MNPSLTPSASSPVSRILGLLLLFGLWGEGARAAESKAADTHTVNVTVTAYTSAVKETDKTPFHGAWGDRLDTVPQGVRAIAVSPDLLRMGLKRGQRVKLKGYKGEFVVLDKTPSRWTHRIDIHMGLDSKAAKRFGKKKAQLSWTGPMLKAAPPKSSKSTRPSKSAKSP